ncbi:hypothetical protein SCHPADRAFT_1002395 [Schizopora paradoxa]|uniref:Uncharacterized protein n=1 Tax=Schizopora paradoxa TaxID=27342 RepID=A0A0H2R4T3_9AGAM|nr:hypothetical protein SCHPADRAFT_1002395 [Schizopora paradoxa]
MSDPNPPEDQAFHPRPLVLSCYSAGFLHDTLRKRLPDLPSLPDGGPKMTYAFGLSFVYEKEAVEDISIDWPQFRSRFLQDVKTVGISGGPPSKKHDNVYKTSDETVFIHWHWENTRLEQMISRRNNCMRDAGNVKSSSHRSTITNAIVSCGISKIYVHKIFAIDKTGPVEGDLLDWLPSGYHHKYEDCDLVFSGGNVINRNVPKSEGNSVNNACARCNSTSSREEIIDSERASTNVRKRTSTRSGDCSEDEDNDALVAVKKRARYAVEESLSCNLGGEEGMNNEHTIVKIEDIKVRVVDGEALAQKSRPRNPNPIMDVRLRAPQLEFGPRLGSSSYSVDMFFTNMENVRSEFEAMRNENERLKLELQAERQRREQAEEAVAAVRKAVSAA